MSVEAKSISTDIINPLAFLSISFNLHNIGLLLITFLVLFVIATPICTLKHHNVFDAVLEKSYMIH